MGRRKHSFLSILLKPQIFIPPEIGRNGKEWKVIKMNRMLVVLFGSNIERMEWNHFMTILLLEPYFKIKG